MLFDSSIHQEVERGGQRLGDPHDEVDAQHLRRAALQSAHLAGGNVSTPLELPLAPASSFAQRLHAPANCSGQLAVGFRKPPVGESRQVTSFGRHSSQHHHCCFPGQVEQVFSHA